MNDYEYRVLVTGSRAWTDKDLVVEALRKVALDSFDQKPSSALTLIHGGAKGLDSMAAEIAAENFWYIESYPADFESFGKSAGPRRNQEMVNSQPDICLAFPLVLDSWSGTMDCMFRADAYGVPVFVNGITPWTRKDFRGTVPSWISGKRSTETGVQTIIDDLEGR
jgi:hypothetical protein